MSRLIKAARRTFRAEATLVVFVVIVFSWSIYGIYKFSVGASDSIFGIQLTAPSATTSAAAATPATPTNGATGDIQASALQHQQAIQRATSGNNNVFLARPSQQQQQLAQLQAELLWPRDHSPKFYASPDVGFNRREGNPTRTATRFAGATNNRPAITYERVRMPGRGRARLPEDTIDQKLRLSSSRKAFEDDNERDFGESRDDSSLAPTEDNRDDYPTGLAVEQPGQTPSDHQPSPDYGDDQESALNTDDNSVVNQPEPAAVESEPETGVAPSDRPAGSQSEQQPQQQQDESEQPESGQDDEEEEEAPKDTGKTIDDEVDRMTQPSSGIVTQQERPITGSRRAPDRNGAVQFDDSTSSDKSPSEQAGQRRQVSPVKAVVATKKQAPSKDLEFDHNTLRVVAAPILSSANRGQQKKNASSASIKPKRPEPISRDTRRVTRVKGNSKVQLTKPEDVDDYLKTVRFDDPLGASASEISVSPTYDPMLSSESQQLALDQLMPNYILHPNFTATHSDQLTSLALSDLQSYPLAPQTASGLEPASAKHLISQKPNPGRSAIGEKQSAADSLYTVDHGLLLYPSTESGHKSKKSHKKGGHKKKMTIAYKKGGEKKKKHEKEEKKFIKEKKFKGAKKGKKIKKGKGGQGGKKGKKKFKDKGYKKKGFKNVYHKEEYGQKKSYFDEFRDKDFKKKWKKYDDNYKYAQMKKWQAKDVKGAKKMKDHGEKMKKYNKSRYKKTYHKDSKEHKHSKDDF